MRNVPTTRFDADGHFQYLSKEQQQQEQQYEKNITQFFEKLDNFTSFRGWKTDAQVAADQAAKDAKDRADWAKAYPNMPYPDVKIGIVVPVGGMGGSATK